MPLQFDQGKSALPQVQRGSKTRKPSSQPSSPAPAVKKKWCRSVALIFGVLTLLAGGGGGLAYYFTSSESPNPPSSPPQPHSPSPPSPLAPPSVFYDASLYANTSVCDAISSKTSCQNKKCYWPSNPGTLCFDVPYFCNATKILCESNPPCKWNENITQCLPDDAWQRVFHDIA